VLPPPFFFKKNWLSQACLQKKKAALFQEQPEGLSSVDTIGM